MSRWLQNVNNLLDQLDGEVESRIHQDKDADDDTDSEGESLDVQYILEAQDSDDDGEDDNSLVDGGEETIQIEVGGDDDVGGDEGQGGVLDIEDDESPRVSDEDEAKQQAIAVNDGEDAVAADLPDEADSETSAPKEGIYTEEKVSDPPRAADVDASFFSSSSQEQIEVVSDIVEEIAPEEGPSGILHGSNLNVDASNVSENDKLGEKTSVPASSLKDNSGIDAEEIDEMEVKVKEMTEKEDAPPGTTTDVIIAGIIGAETAARGLKLDKKMMSTDTSIKAIDPPSTADAAELTAKAIVSATAKHKQIVAALQKTHKAGLAAEAAKQKQVTATLEKQIRKLNRAIKQKNHDLDAAQKEIEAQQKELYQAADRIDDDKAKYSNILSDLKAAHKDVMATAAQEHELAISGLRTSHQIQIDELKNELKRAEEDRSNEAGDWEGELEIALRREQEGLKKVVLLEDENSTLTSQVSSLQTLLDAAQSRITSSTTTASAASEREREAFEKLDAALSVHARQIAQRQARETELERKVGELSTALVEVQHREKLVTGIHHIAGQNSSEGGDISVKALKEEIGSLTTILSQERQHNSTLKNEVKTMSEERSKEDASVIAKQRLHEREAAELAMTISKLEGNVRDKDAFIEKLNRKQTTTGLSNSGTVELQSRVDSLSEQVLRQQARIESSISETSALRQRLRVALSRADTAEKALVDMNNSSDIDSGFESMEEGISPIRNSIMRRRRNRGNGGSIRSAISFNGRGDTRKENIAKAIDLVDKLSVEAGIYFRYNPLARGGFVLYLILLHLWTFSLIVFHVHSTEPLHGDFDQGFGPGSLPGVQNSLRDTKGN